jgi:hypothetical protein
MPMVEGDEKSAAVQFDWQAVNQEVHSARWRVAHAFLKSDAGEWSGPTPQTLSVHFE